MTAGHSLRAFWALLVKDLVSEIRSRRTWPMMLFMGLLLVLLMELQIELPAEQKQEVICGLLWLDLLFAGTLALERSFAGEREEGCWRTLFCYPVAPTVIFLAKMAANFVALVLLEAVLVPAFVIFSGVSLFEQPLGLGLVLLLGNLGFVSVGVLASALTSHSAHRGGLLALVLLPLATPVLLGAAAATRLAVVGDLSEQWWGWIHLLAAFAILFTSLGLLVFHFAIEE